MAADDIAKGALHLINWGKKLMPATAEEVAQFGPNASRVKALVKMVRGLSDDAVKVAGDATISKMPLIKNTIQTLNRNADEARKVFAREAYGYGASGTDRLIYSANTNAPAAWDAAGSGGAAESMADILTSQDYRTLLNPITAARSFDFSKSRTPEGFTNIARSLGERGLITAPKDIVVARQVAQLPPAMQQVYLDLVGEGTDPAQLLQALRLMGQ